jgi:23S rRNA (cytidine1920-2'-O)/16S rRNA (cytidine1409-2'-O)-methyltransferase
MERTNIRKVTPDMIGEPLDGASIDVAFISLAKVLPVAKVLLKPKGEIIALIKPQFEAGRGSVGKKGVVRDPEVHAEVIRKVAATARELGFVAMMLTFSPVKGPEGNIEYLVRLSKDQGMVDAVDEARICSVVEEAHAALDK